MRNVLDPDAAKARGTTMNRKLLVAAWLGLVLAAGFSARPGKALLAAEVSPRQAGGGRAAGPQTPAADPVVIERGRLAFMQNCVFCHGADARGGAEGGSDLTRSTIVAGDRDGAELAAFLRVGRPDKKMPPFELPAAQLSDLATYLHSLAVPAGRGRGGAVSIDIVGNSTAGQAFFNGAGGCARCHSVTGDLKGIGTRLGAFALQARIVLPRSNNGGYPGVGVSVLDPPRTATVKEASGKVTTGKVLDVSDFVITLRDADGNRHTFLRNGDVPAVELRDPLQGHIDMMPRLTDANIHDLAAYLLTVR
jgi:mono/diheme cytochrome c family protein